MYFNSVSNKKKIGLYFGTLGETQAVYEGITSANKLAAHSQAYDCSLFYANLSAPVIEPHFGSFQSNAAWKFNGTMIATNLMDAEFISKLVSTRRKIFYVYDLQWHGHDNLPPAFRRAPWEACSAIYGNPSLELWARSESHAKALSDAFNVKVAGIMRNFNLETLFDERTNI